MAGRDQLVHYHIDLDRPLLSREGESEGLFPGTNRNLMRKTLREPALVLTLVVVVGLLGFFVIYPQLRVVLVPGLAGYVEFFREQTWVKPLLHSLQITVLSTTMAVTLGFVYAYAMVY